MRPEQEPLEVDYDPWVEWSGPARSGQPDRPTRKKPGDRSVICPNCGFQNASPRRVLWIVRALPGLERPERPDRRDHRLFTATKCATEHSRSPPPRAAAGLPAADSARIDAASPQVPPPPGTVHPGDQLAGRSAALRRLWHCQRAVAHLLSELRCQAQEGRHYDGHCARPWRRRGMSAAATYRMIGYELGGALLFVVSRGRARSSCLAACHPAPPISACDAARRRRSRLNRARLRPPR